MRKTAATWQRAGAVVLSLSLVAPPAAARSPRKAKPAAAAEAELPAVPDEASPYASGRSWDRKRSDVFFPLVNVLLPGLDQWIEGQYLAGALYTGTALGGLSYASATAKADDVKAKVERPEGEADAADEPTHLDEKDVARRKVMLGGLVYQGAAGMSIHHSFRTAVRSRQPYGQYGFLAKEETPAELLLAPFDFRYLARASTWVPLAVIGAISYLSLSSEPPEKYERDKLSSADWAFTGAYSYNAGTHEEAVFRGYLMPVFHEYGLSPFWSNAAQSVAFALAHLGTNAFPLPQLLLGYHLGNVTQRNDWTLGEAIFIHVWWDVVAFATAFSYKRRSTQDQATALAPVLWLPPLEWRF